MLVLGKSGKAPRLCFVVLRFGVFIPAGQHCLHGSTACNAYWFVRVFLGLATCSLGCTGIEILCVPAAC